ncbi:MAG: type II secretion system inner membrane protein GspF [Deltaproteobacteria bacterium]|nr:type II secretion system inner membrane protein GspF [Deltaproteobacteria bacterium]
MPVFEFKGFDSAGKTVKGLRDADSVKALRSLLKKEGVLATEVNESGKGATKGKGKKEGKGEGLLDREVDLAFLQRVNTEDLALATRQLATLLQAGVPMVDSLSALIDQTENKALKRILSKIKTEVNEGISLGDAMARHHKLFDHIFVNMVRAGESSGTLDVVLERLADFKEGQAKIQGEIIGSLMYPMIMVFVGVINISVLFTVVVPRITKIFEHAKVQLPLQTRMLMFMSSAVKDYWWLILIVLVASIFLFTRWRGSKRGRAQWDTLVLKLPVVGVLIRMIAVSRFARTLGTLLSSGVSLLVSLDIVKNVVANTRIMHAIEVAAEAIREGEDIAAPLKRSGEFPPMVIHMIAIGEKSGQLEQMLNRVAIAYEQRVDVRLKGLMSLLSPLLILAMGGAVGFIVFSILTPILQMNTLVK